MVNYTPQTGSSTLLRSGFGYQSSIITYRHDQFFMIKKQTNKQKTRFHISETNHNEFAL